MNACDARAGEVRPRERDPAKVCLEQIRAFCYLNGFEEAQELLQESRPWLKKRDSRAYLSLKEALRILRKVRYN